MAVFTPSLFKKQAHSGTTDRRLFLRKKTIIPAILKLKHRLDSGHTCAATILNISQEGALLNIPTPPVINEIILLECEDSRLFFELPPNALPLIVNCELCRVYKRPGSLHIGAQFKDIYPKSLTALISYIVGGNAGQEHPAAQRA